MIKILTARYWFLSLLKRNSGDIYGRLRLTYRTLGISKLIVISNLHRKYIWHLGCMKIFFRLWEVFHRLNLYHFLHFLVHYTRSVSFRFNPFVLWQTLSPIFQNRKRIIGTLARGMKVLCTMGGFKVYFPYIFEERGILLQSLNQNGVLRPNSISIYMACKQDLGWLPSLFSKPDILDAARLFPWAS